MKKKIIAGVITTVLLCQISTLSIFADEIKDLGEKNSDKNMTDSTIIDIPDENFKAVLNEELGQPANSNITKGQLENISRIYAYEKNIKNIEGIQYCTNLRELNLYHNKISDISPLSNLNVPNLTRLSLYSNKISDISPLSNLNVPNLNELDLGFNQISDISPLSNLNLSNLTRLSLYYNKISDISSLSNLNAPNLEILWLHDNEISDISPLSNLNLPKLNNLVLSNNQISDIAPLSNLNLSNLNSLWLNGQTFTKDKKWSRGKFFQIANPLKDIDGNTIVPTLDNGGIYINDNPNYPTGLMKWNNINKLANNEAGKVVDLTYTFNKYFTVGTNNTQVEFDGTVHQPVEYYKGFEPVINAPDIIIRKGTPFKPMEGVTATDKFGEVDDKGNLINPNEKPKNITKDVKVISGVVNVYVPGTYTLVYQVTDSWGNTVTKERKVTVADTLKVEEIVGSDRYNTANKISDKWTRADNVVIANSDLIVDAMTASPFAYAKNAPVLLSNKSSLTSETKASIARLQSKTVYLIGGENSLDKNLEKEIKDMGVNVVRIGGKDRFETSLKIAKEVDNISDVSQVAVVNGQKGLPDAISISSPAAINNMPIILSNNEGDIPQGKDFIKTEDLSKAYVIGGNSAVSEKLKTEVSDLINNKAVDRLGGKDRLETNTIVLNEFYKSGALNNLFVVKDGEKREIDLIDSLSVSSLAAKEKSPIMIVGENLTAEQSEFIKKKEFSKLTRVGGNGNENAFNQIVKLVKN